MIFAYTLDVSFHLYFGCGYTRQSVVVKRNAPLQQLLMATSNGSTMASVCSLFNGTKWKLPNIMKNEEFRKHTPSLDRSIFYWTMFLFFFFGPFNDLRPAAIWHADKSEAIASFRPVCVSIFFLIAFIRRYIYTRHNSCIAHKWYFSIFENDTDSEIMKNIIVRRHTLYADFANEKQKQKKTEEKWSKKKETLAAHNMCA